MKQVLKTFMLVAVFLIATLYKTHAQSCPMSSPWSGYCSASDNSSVWQFGDLIWDMSCPTGHIGYELTAYAPSSGNATAQVWIGINEMAYSAGNGYQTNSNTITVPGTSISFEGLVNVYNGYASIYIHGW